MNGPRVDGLKLLFRRSNIQKLMPPRSLIEIFVMLAGAFVLGYLWRGVSGVAKVLPQTAKQQPDDLMKIKGMTQRSEELLNEAAIYTYRQLAATDVVRIKEILEDGGVKKLDPSSWPKEAARLKS